jgi:hypothetical protein
MLAYFMEVQTKFLCLDVLKIWSKLWYMYKDMPCLLHEKKKKENFDLTHTDVYTMCCYYKFPAPVASRGSSHQGEC